jgi:DNA repair exonuclease SbcCD ATPase subunit
VTVFLSLAALKTTLRKTPLLVVSIVLSMAVCPLTPAWGQGKDKAKKKEEVPAWRRALPNTAAVRQALEQYDDAEAKAKEVLQKARSSAMGIEQAQADVRSAIAERDETIDSAKQRYAEQFELESLIKKKTLAAATSEEASKPVLDELRKSPSYLEKKAILDEAEQAHTRAKEQSNAAAEAKTRARVSEATQELKKFERTKLDEDPRLSAVRGKVHELEEQIASAKSKIAGLVNKDEAVAAAEADLNKARAAVGEARKTAKESQVAAAAAEANVAMHLEKVQLMARRARDPLRRRTDDANAKNDNNKKN